MKKSKLNSLKRITFIGVLVSTLLFSFSSCAVKKSFMDSPVVPAAEGTVKVKRDKNMNYNIQVNVTGLAEVERLQTNKNNYVVWMITDQGRTENLGQFKISNSMFSKKLQASIETSSSYKPSKIFITAEMNTDVMSPSEEIILTTDSF
jgi:hypothetical protein